MLWGVGMQTIQLQVEVKADRSLTIPLPPNVAAGLYEVVVVMQPQSEVRTTSQDWEQYWENLAVFRAKIAERFGCSDRDWVAEARVDRETDLGQWLGLIE